MDKFEMMAHVFCGVAGTLLAVAVFMDVLNASSTNHQRIKYLSLLMALAMVLSYVLGGAWYINDYPADKAIILAGAWGWAHEFFMEVKEHLFFMLLLLSLYLPLVTYSERLVTEAGFKKLALTTLGCIIALGLTMDGFGAIIAMGVRIGLER